MIAVEEDATAAAVISEILGSVLTGFLVSEDIVLEAVDATVDDVAAVDEEIGENEIKYRYRGPVYIYEMHRSWHQF